MRSDLGYGVVLMTVAVFYGAVAAYRRSIMAGVLALLAINGALWTLLWHSPAVAFSRHPQPWLIPPALSTIAASYFMRDRLDAKARSGVRYAGLLLAYLASSADVFLVGVARAPWLAGVLALLSVLGVMAGIALRIRSFLYTGTAFLVVSLATLIYHAMANLHQTWLLWLAGIGLGVSILLAFAMFEKHRGRVMELIDGLKSWDA